MISTNPTDSPQEELEGYEGRIYVGKFNVEIRALYLAYKIARYKFEHPNDIKHAGKYARVAWRRKASNHKRK